MRLREGLRTVALLVGLGGVVVMRPADVAAQSGVAQVAEVAAIPTASRDLARGVVLAAADIDASADASASDGILGWVTRRVISQGEPLKHPAIAPPELVRSGDAVQLVWSGGGIELRLRGQAMGSAALGEKVLVRVDSKRRFEGTVEAPGIVRVNIPAATERR